MANEYDIRAAKNEEIGTDLRDMRNMSNAYIRKWNEKTSGLQTQINQKTSELQTQLSEKVSDLQNQMNEVVAQGDSSVEAAQARVDSEGNTFATLKMRLDTKEAMFDEKLAEKGLLASSFKTESNTWNDAINSAMTMAYSRIIQLPPESIEIVSPIVVNSAVTFYGQKGMTQITSTSQMETAFINGTGNIEELNLIGITFVGGVVDEGQTEPQRLRTKNPGFSRALYLNGDLMPGSTTNPVIKNVRIQDCRFKNLSYLPVFFGGIRGYSQMLDCIVDNCLDSGFTYCENVFFNRNRVTRSADNGVSLSRGNKNVVCIGNYMENSSYAGIWLSGWQGGTGATGSGPSSFVCTGNIVVNSGWSGIHLEDAPKRGIVANNVIDGVLKGPIDGVDDSKGVGITVKPFPSNVYPVTTSNIVEYAQDLMILDNLITNADRGGISVRGLLGGVIRGNRILNVGSTKKADGSTDVTPSTTENFGILLDTQSGNTIQDISVESNVIIDNRTETMLDGTRITNYPMVCGFGLRLKFKNNDCYGTQAGLTDGLKQNGEFSNNLESILHAKASSNSGANTTSIVTADVDGYYRMGIMKRSGSLPIIATSTGTPFELYRSNKASLLDSTGTFVRMMKVDIEPNSSQYAIWLGTGTVYIRKDANPESDNVDGYRTNGYLTAEAGLRTQGTYSGGHLILGSYHVWVDSNGKLRVKNGKPTTDQDGTIVGLQS